MNRPWARPTRRSAEKWQFTAHCRVLAQADNRIRPRRRRALMTTRDRRASPSDGENRAFSTSCGCWVGTSASSQPRFVVPVPRVRGVSRRGDGPVEQVRSTRRDDLCIWRAKTRVHQTAGTGRDNLAHDPPRDQAEAQRQAAHRGCTIPSTPCELAPPSTPVDAGVENFLTGGPRAGDRSTTTVE